MAKERKTAGPRYGVSLCAVCGRPITEGQRWGFVKRRGWSSVWFHLSCLKKGDGSRGGS